MQTLTLPTPQERRQIAAHSLMPERQVLKAYQDPDHRRPSTLERVRRSAIALGIVPPGHQKDAA